VKPGALVDSLRRLQRILAIAEQDYVPINLQPYGEPQLGRRGLYRAIGGEHGEREPHDQMTLLWMLSLADGRCSLFDIAERCGKPFEAVVSAARALTRAELLAPAEGRVL
jgi:aminopeptidase-like protein